MALFQKNVLKKHLSLLDKSVVTEAYKRYQSYFLNTEIQSNIRSSKEEQFQEGFLRELFVRVLGYTLNPSPNYNLITEQKNETNAKKADGAILVNGNVVGVIELKDGKTTDLSKVEQQAFGYKSQNKNATYVIISNFEKLRFYIDNAVEYYEFDLFHLTENEFAILYLLLAYPQIESNIPKHIKEESLSREDAVTKALYKDYSEFKRELFADILEQNKVDTIEEKVVLFKKTQKLLDRLLFIFFAEDSLLLTPNTMIRIISDWEKLKELDEYKPLYERIKKYFDWLNYGYKGKDFEVFAYNGGLFKNDDVLDSLTISDDVLLTHTRKLSEYDYASEVDVNILGHIFENSLTEIEEITNQLKDGGSPSISKRKKDGVFYTPQYITKYIVENTIGKLCYDKKAEFGIVESEYFSDKKRQIATKKSLLHKLENYRDWLKGITICDPACGSGAFLSAALQFLKKEHHLINEMQAKITGGGMAFAYFDNDILENNLYGVDINEESVEIAKLALWLRTAQPNRKLSSLNNNIKCGNSLVSNPTIAGDKAFDWKIEFPEVFEHGGFDVVIGNPPYVKEYTNKSSFTGLHNNPCYQSKMDLWYFFGSLAIDIVKENGYIGYIAPSNWITNEGAGNFRNIVIRNSQLLQYIDFGDFKVFSDAGIQTMIYIMIRSIEREIYNVQYSKILDKNVTDMDVVDFLSGSKSEKFLYCTSTIRREKNINQYIKFVDSNISNLLDKIKSIPHYYLLNNEVGQGIVGAPDESFIVSFDGIDRFSEEECQYIKPYYTGLPDRYTSRPVEKYIIYLSAQNFDQKDITEYPQLCNHFEPYKDVLKSARVKYGTPNKPYYYLHRERIENFFKKGYGKIISQGRCLYPRFYYTEEDYYASRAMFIIQTNKFDLKYLTAFLNSKLCRFWLKNKGKMQGDNYQVDKEPLQNIPIPIIDKTDQQQFANLTNVIQSSCRDMQNKRNRFCRRLKDNFKDIKITGALETFDLLEFKEFIHELGKQKIKLSLVQQDEWEEYFGQYKLECNAITEQISVVDKQIDRLVYQLYNLTEEEISIIESN